MDIPKRSPLKPLKRISPETKSLSKRPISCPKNDPIHDLSPIIELVEDLLNCFEQVFIAYDPSRSDLDTKSLSNYKHVSLIEKNYCNILPGQHPQVIFGSKPLLGTWNAIICCIEQWMKPPSYQSYIGSISQEEKSHAVAFNEGTQIWVAYEEDQKVKVELIIAQEARKAVKN
ncbi:hypothetical protein CROQUDRAFT_45511 [Cronartium quercuum f. sp. fusiforme G11]|uniref:Uncharacterized protein n=1 Tax=Cronartium quercuum f. sp. fusiforme G11 TaxID=708437 RepID=A0A9P6NK98_9BASI|nr:hypothetical protein CROQUDRAFT_45511 [Cronartium quercuum f. sp. fusiforme G11]